MIIFNQIPNFSCIISLEGFEQFICKFILRISFLFYVYVNPFRVFPVVFFFFDFAKAIVQATFSLFHLLIICRDRLRHSCD